MCDLVFIAYSRSWNEAHTYDDSAAHAKFVIPLQSQQKYETCDNCA